MKNFQLIKTSSNSKARLGVMLTRKGKIQTPFFMTIGTQGVVKTLTTEDVRRIGAPIILANTYHLYLRPGLEVLKKQRGLHRFMDFVGPILTDSGGYQVFSLSKIRKIKTEGVEFQSTYDGSKHLFTPKKVLQIQKVIDSDIRMVLDVCSPSKCSRAQAEKDLAITLAWANQAKKYQAQDGSLLFAIVQGALFKDLRLQSAAAVVKMDFSGYAIGGLAVGETNEEMYSILDYTVPALPANKARYLMGVGYPENIVEAVKRGIDMFDCVIPTREARHGRLYKFIKVKKIGKLSKGVIRLFGPSATASPKACRAGDVGYTTFTITNEKFKNDLTAINKDSKLKELRIYSKAYLRHLFSVSEPLALRLATLNNVEFYLQLMEKIRQGIKQRLI
ncbi:MAG: tRNA guanosine(34) transglycosylase Tgt [Candidatus Komeilibacteria bacterium]|nr:tRNA guanosine(34) transglycosylase Tgt [Candidatus Komeilibacteria bacterium]